MSRYSTEKKSEIFGFAECEIIHFVNCEISPFGRCEMKFAHIRVSKYFTAKLFHLPKGQISLKKSQRDCVRLFSWQGWEDSVSSLRRKAEFLISALLRDLGIAQPQKLALLIFGNPARAALTTHCVVIHYRSPSSPPQIVSQQKEKVHEKIVDFIFLAGAGGLEPATHGFGVAPKCLKALELLAFFARFNALLTQNHVS